MRWVHKYIRSFVQPAFLSTFVEQTFLRFSSFTLLTSSIFFRPVDLSGCYFSAIFSMINCEVERRHEEKEKGQVYTLISVLSSLATYGDMLTGNSSSPEVVICRSRRWPTPRTGAVKLNLLESSNARLNFHYQN